MNRINPIYIAVFLILILLILLMSLSSSKSELAEVKSEYKQTQEIASKLLGLKGAYGDKNEVKKSLKKLLAISQLRSAKIEQKTRKGSIVLSSKSIDKKALNALMGKLLNKTYNITALKIKKQSPNSVSFEMEIAW